MNRIFIESGKSNTNESQFLQTVLKKILDKEIKKDYEIVNTGGWCNLNNVSGKFLESENDNDKNIVIFDSDYACTDGGFERRKKFLEDKAAELDIKFELFLFPNNSDDGIFETLLQRIINPEYSKILDFFKEYEDKITEYNRSLPKDTFETPDEKARIYSYISLFKRSNREKEEFKNKNNWNFENKKYWNLDSDELKPLVIFLKGLFI